MYFFLSRGVARPCSILVLITTNLVVSLPVPASKRTPEEVSIDSKNGFSNSPKVLEIQLPLKVATKDDLVAWAKYVMGLMASKINITLSTVKEPTAKSEGSLRNSSRNISLLSERQVPNGDQPAVRINNGIDPRSMLIGGQLPRGFSSPNYAESSTRIPIEFIENFEIPRTKEPDFRRAFEGQNSLRTRDNHQLFLPQYPDFGTRPPFDLKDNEILRNPNVLTTPPSGAYLPIPLKTSDILHFQNNPFATRYFFDGVERNISSNLGSVGSDAAAFTARMPTFSSDNELVTALPIKLADLVARRNLSSPVKPILSLPFEAVITITRDENGDSTTARPEIDNYFAVTSRSPPDEFPPYFEKNYTQTNASGRINVVFADDDQNIDKQNFTADDTDTRKNADKKQETSKRQRSKKKSKKRQSTSVGELLKLLGLFRRNNSAEVDLSPPPRIMKVPSPQSYQEKPSSGQARRNRTFAAQQIEDDDVEDVDNDNGNEDETNSTTETNPSSDDYDDYDNEEGGGGGSIQAIVDLLPLVGPILEDLSDPESETDIGEVIQAAIPVLEGLSEADEDGEGIDIPGVLVPILQKISGGEDGQVDSGAILGPLIQLIAPLIGPVVGPLLGPLSRQISNPPGEGGSSSSSIVTGLIGPLSQPAGPWKMSPLSNLLAGVVSSLSKEFVSGKAGVDLSTLVGQLVSGVIAGTSAGLSGHKDSAVAPTSYGGYGGYGGNTVSANSISPIALIGSSIKDILNAGLKVASSLIGALTGILGASSHDSPRPAYGPPTSYGGSPPTSYASPTNGPYNQANRGPKRQSRP